MLLRSILNDNAAGIFRDFAAAFPSISQEFCFKVLEDAGLPTSELNAMKALYSNSRCKISMKGDVYEGFVLAAGVRQGCPLSPLIYHALVAETLLDKLEIEICNIFTRAYADDTCLVLEDFIRDAPRVAELFQEFEKISGLKLNMSKSIAIPLNADPPQNFP